MAELGAFFGNPNIQRQGARARALAGQRDVNTLADPRTYAIVQGLLGTAPDQMGFSVLNPDYEKIRKAAEPAFALGLLGQAAPLLAPMTKGLPVGATIKPININKGIYKPDLTMEEMLKVRDIPTVERVKQSIDLVGEKEFEKLVNTQFKKYKPSSPDQEAMLVESVTLQVLGKAQRSPFPQKEALDKAQRNAALPVEEGLLSVQKEQPMQGLLESKIPSPSSLTMPDVPTMEQMQKYGRVETVPLSKAVSFQSARNWDKFNKGEYSGDLVKGFGDKPLALRLENGEYIIYDGNHRTDLAMQAGKKEMPMNVIDVKSYDPSNAGRRPVPPSMTDDELLRSLLE